MSTGLFPHRPPVDEPEGGTRVATLGSGEAAAVCTLLGTETATAILDRLVDAPATASDLSAGMDTSLQNVDYHLKRLEEAGLVRAVGTWLSERGTEMTVYAATHDRFVLEPGGADDGDRATGGDVEAREGARATGGDGEPPGAADPDRAQPVGDD